MSGDRPSRGKGFSTETEHGYENANLGDDSRKNKFLRLMGSKKKEEPPKALAREASDLAGDTVRSVLQPAPEPEDTVEVKSANEWEAANMGDVSRKNKFLRLMGATKKEHSGKFVIGEKKIEETRKDAASETGLEEKLEKQYNEGLQLRLTGAARRHTGFGFEEPPLPAPETERQTVEAGAAASGVEAPENKESKNSDQLHRDRHYREERRESRRFEEQDRGKRHGDLHPGDGDTSYDGGNNPRDSSGGHYSHKRRDYDSRDRRSERSGDRREYHKDRPDHRDDYGRQKREYGQERISHDGRERHERQRVGYTGNQDRSYTSGDSHERSSQQQGYGNAQQNQPVVSGGSRVPQSSSKAPTVGEYGTPPAGSSHANPNGQPTVPCGAGYTVPVQGYPNPQVVNPNGQQANLPSGGYTATHGYQSSYSQPPPPPPPAPVQGGHTWYDGASGGNTPQSALYTIAAPPPPPPPTGPPSHTGQQAHPSQTQTAGHGHQMTTYPARGIPSQQHQTQQLHSGAYGHPHQPVQGASPGLTSAASALFKSKISFVKSDDS